jgi:hypothetical protein
MGPLVLMTLLDSKPPAPPSGLRKYVPLPILILVLVFLALMAVLVGYRLWDYPEERAVSRFLAAVEQAHYQEAYKLWQPSPSYSFDDFLRGWGEQGDYGRIRGFEILHSKSKGSNTVIVTVRINNVDPPLDLLVDRKTKGLAYSFY